MLCYLTSRDYDSGWPVVCSSYDTGFALLLLSVSRSICLEIFSGQGYFDELQSQDGVINETS